MLEQLPTEIIENIFGYTGIEEKKNVSCCSRTCNSLLRPILWRDVRIPFFECDLSADALARNLKHTECLVLGQYCGTYDEEGDPVVGCQDMIRGGFR